MTAAVLIKLLIEGAPIAIKIVKDAQAGVLPSVEDWKELQTLGSYSSKEAMEK